MLSNGISSPWSVSALALAFEFDAARPIDELEADMVSSSWPFSSSSSVISTVPRREGVVVVVERRAALEVDARVGVPNDAAAASCDIVVDSSRLDR